MAYDTGTILDSNDPGGALYTALGGDVHSATITSDGDVLTIVSGVPAFAAPGSGSGTVTSVNATGANGIGVSGVPITTAGTIALSLGAITPSSVAATGAVTGSNLSGTNTGDQTISLTTDVTGTGTGSIATTIAANAVTYAKMQAVSATSKLLGSSSTTTPVQELSLGSGLSLTGTTLSATGSGGTVTNVTGTSPIASSGGTTPAISIADAAADGSTKGAAAFATNDFDSASGVISIDYTNGQAADASHKGFLTSTDWSTFNGKGNGTVTNVTGTSPVASSGGATPAISIADAAADGSTKGAASFAAADFNATSGNISLDYTNGQKASGSQPGFLSSADWTTFNNKGNQTLGLNYVISRGISMQ